MNMHCNEYVQQHEYAYVCTMRVNRIEVFILCLVVVDYGCYITQCEWIYYSCGVRVCYTIIVSIYSVILYSYFGDIIVQKVLLFITLRFVSLIIKTRNFSFLLASSIGLFSYLVWSEIISLEFSRLKIKRMLVINVIMI